ALLAALPLAFAQRKTRAAQVAHLLDALAPLEPLGQLPDRALAHAEDDQVGLGVEQDRAPYLLAPVVEVRDASQRRLDAPDHDRHAREGPARQVRIDDGGP